MKKSFSLSTPSRLSIHNRLLTTFKYLLLPLHRPRSPRKKRAKMKMSWFQSRQNLHPFSRSNQSLPFKKKNPKLKKESSLTLARCCHQVVVAWASRPPRLTVKHWWPELLRHWSPHRLVNLCPLPLLVVADARHLKLSWTFPTLLASLKWNTKTI